MISNKVLFKAEKKTPETESNNFLFDFGFVEIFGRENKSYF